MDFPVKAHAAIFADTPRVQTLVQSLNIGGIRLRLRGMFVTSTKIRTSGELHILHGIIYRVPVTAKR